MKKMIRTLKLAMFAFIGIFAGGAAVRSIDYARHPEKYIADSAPWYLPIQLQGLVTAVIVLICLTAIYAIRHADPKD